MKTPRMPAADGAVIEVRRSERSLAKGDAHFAETLQIYWFGSGCHLIRLGNLSVLTDPFVSNGFNPANARSSPQRVGATFAKLRAPDAILINHSHVDHLLDAYAALTLPDWRKAGVPMYGGQTSRNILASWQDPEVLDRCHVVPDGGGVIIDQKRPNGERLRVTAYRSRHGPHLKCGHTFFNGNLSKPLTHPPSTLHDFQAGEVFNYLVTLKRKSTVFRIFCLGAFADLDESPNSLPPHGTKIDVAILCTPGAQNLSGYPEQHLARLRPRHIVLSHFNTFLKNDSDQQLSIAGIDVVKLDDFSQKVQQCLTLGTRGYPEFEKLHIPAITIMESRNQARNVIRVR